MSQGGEDERDPRIKVQLSTRIQIGDAFPVDPRVFDGRRWPAREYEYCSVVKVNQNWFQRADVAIYGSRSCFKRSCYVRAPDLSALFLLNPLLRSGLTDSFSGAPAAARLTESRVYLLILLTGGMHSIEDFDSFKRLRLYLTATRAARFQPTLKRGAIDVWSSKLTGNIQQ